MMNNAKTKLMYWLVDKIAPVASLFYHPPTWNHTIDNLLQLPDNTLGKQTALLLKKKQLTFVPKYESHDFKHVLLDYEMDGLGETRMVFFAFGNGNRSFITCISMILGIHLYPMQLKLFYKDYVRGKHSANISHWDFATLATEPCSLLKQKLYQP
jgi:ubiquinone biosynthesis protein Coq4